MDMEILKEILRRRKVKAAEKLSDQMDGDEGLMEKTEVVIGDDSVIDDVKKAPDSSSDELAPSKKELRSAYEDGDAVKEDPVPEKEDIEEKVEVKKKDFGFKPFGKKEGEKPKKEKSSFTDKLMAKIGNR